MAAVVEDTELINHHQPTNKQTNNNLHLVITEAKPPFSSIYPYIYYYYYYYHYHNNNL